MKNMFLAGLVLLLVSCGESGSSSGTSNNPYITGTGTWSAGNPDGSCSTAMPPEGLPAATSTPTNVVGTGTAGSCTFAQLKTAVAAGGVITFNCGSKAVTIPVTATLDLPTDRDTVIDGGKLITLDGQNTVRIMSFNGGNFQVNVHRLTLQHIALINGKTTPTLAIPTQPSYPACSQGWNDGEGGALIMLDGNLSVIDSIFSGNHGATLGPDTGGGAIYVKASKYGVVIAGSTFSNNAASNAGAVGGLYADLRIYNSLFSNNTAVGHDANDVNQSQCPVQNNNQYEIGSGGNGGAIYSDGQSVNVLLCGDKITGNSAGTNAYGGGLFFTSNNWNSLNGGTLSILDTVMTGNTGGHWTQVSTGSVTNAGTAVGTNCRSLGVQNSTLQGYP